MNTFKIGDTVEFCGYQSWGEFYKGPLKVERWYGLHVVWRNDRTSFCSLDAWSSQFQLYTGLEYEYV